MSLEHSIQQFEMIFEGNTMALESRFETLSNAITKSIEMVCNEIKNPDLYCHYKINTKVCNEIKKSV